MMKDFIDMNVQDKSFTIYLTERCQLNCDYCFVPKKTNDMNEQVKQKTIAFVQNTINTTEGKWKITITGGEVGLLDPVDVISFVKDLKSKITKPVEVCLVTNLVYKITNDHLRLFKTVDHIGLSYDGSIRLDNYQKRKLWFGNIRYLQQNGITDITLMCLMTHQLISNDPQFFLDFIIALQLQKCELWPVYQDSGRKYKPTNKQVNEWMYRVFIEYQKIRKIDKDFEIMTFECQKAAFYNYNYYEYSRQCVCNDSDILVDGTVGSCSIEFLTPYGNLDHIDNEKKTIWIAKEQTIDDRCKHCQHLSYCRGRCWKLSWDSTDCPVPKKIFEYLKLVEQSE